MSINLDLPMCAAARARGQCHMGQGRSDLPAEQHRRVGCRGNGCGPHHAHREECGPTQRWRDLRHNQGTTVHVSNLKNRVVFF